MKGLRGLRGLAGPICSDMSEGVTEVSHGISLATPKLAQV